MDLGIPLRRHQRSDSLRQDLSLQRLDPGENRAIVDFCKEFQGSKPFGLIEKHSRCYRFGLIINENF